MTTAPHHLLDTLFEAVIIVDEKADIIYFNHHFSTLSKSSPRQIQKKKNLCEIFHFSLDQITKLLHAAKNSKAPQLTSEQEINLRDEFTEKYIFITKVTALESGEFLICFNDMTIENRLYEKYKLQLKELEQTHNQIVQADKLTTIGEMTANISHEISNPLTIAAGNLEIVEALLENEISVPELEIIRSCVLDIKDSHQRINSIMTNMKTFLHQSESQREYTDLNRLIEKTVQFMSPKLEEARIKVEIIKKTPDAIGLVDPGQIEQVFMNLLKNAIDAYQKNPGKVTITIERDHHLNMITFCDQGLGILEQNKDKIFEAFFTTKKIGEGTGLGLAISQKILRAHKGELVLLDYEGGGAQFQLKLPSIELMSFTQNEFHLGRKKSTELKRILIVDDEVKILNILNTIISDLGMVFIGSANPLDALAMLEELPLDLIIVDYVMPQMNGEEFAKKVREINKTVPILYLSSADNEDKFKKDQKPLGLHGIVVKPFSRQSITEMIEKTLKVGEIK